MQIHAKWLNRPLCAAAVLLVAACDGPTAPPSALAERAAAAAKPSAQPERKPTALTERNCLATVWRAQQNRDERFDRAHDRVEGGTISCATGTTPSRFRDAIAALRSGAEDRSGPRILEQIGLPLLHIDPAGKTTRLQSKAAVEASFDSVFDDKTLQALRRAKLDQLTVVPKQGGFLELGGLWLVAPGPGMQPRLVTVNQQALREAEAARNRAARPAP